MPKDLNEILGLDFDINRFRKRADQINLIISASKVNRNILELEKINEKLGDLDFEEFEQHDSEIALIKFREKYKEDEYNGYTIREIRILITHLTYSSDDEISIMNSIDVFDYFLRVIQHNWRDTFLISLVHVLFTNWNNSNQFPIDKLKKLITSKLLLYKGSRSSLIKLGKNCIYFRSVKTGLKLGKDCYDNNVRLDEITSYIGLNHRWINTSFFSDPIFAYVYSQVKNNEADLDNILAIIEKHNHRETYMRVLPILILSDLIVSDATKKLKLKDMSFKILGDPAIRANWSMKKSVNKTDQDNLEKARVRVNQWITEEFITVFFEKCINDPRRKAFWLRCSRAIDEFVVIGPYWIKNKLKNDKRISELVNDRFIRSGDSGNVSAIAMSVNSLLLVEFSTHGNAFYSYKHDTMNINKIRADRPNVSELKKPYLPLLSKTLNGYVHTIRQEGRMIHSNYNWEAKFIRWMRNVGIDV